MNILGLSCYYHDSAACLVRDGEIVAAAQEERFSRRKHDPRFPSGAVAYCLAEGGISIRDLDHVVFYDKPLPTFERLLLSYLTVAPRGLRSWLEAMPQWLGKKLHLPRVIRSELGYTGDILFTEHHEAHAASAFYPSPFKTAAILTIDGVGEWATASLGVGNGSELTLLKEMHFPDSLGLLYSAFTCFCGFRVNSGEYKLMGLAPYGTPRFRDIILDKLIDLKQDGSLRLNLDYFGFLSGLRMTNARFSRLFEGPPRKPEAVITRREMDIAASIQAVTEEAVLRMGHTLFRETGIRNLCMAGGVALNCVANGRLLREGPFERIWIQPAAGDAGGALGAALSVWHRYCGKERKTPTTRDHQKGSLLGPRYGRDEIVTRLRTHGAVFHELPPENRARTIAQLLAEGKIVGHFSGRMEYGPRALGARSILADARNSATQSTLNLKIKFRESFRPFAPAVLEERSQDLFDLPTDSPYMLLVGHVRKDLRMPEGDSSENDMLKRLEQKRSEIPAVTHLDYSARLQTVDAHTHPEFHEIIQAFEQQTGCPVIVNTSFNVRGEPIVCSPDDAYRCFMRTEMDVLILEDLLLHKSGQPRWSEPCEWRRDLILD